MKGDCCWRAYTCPQTGERECLFHGDFDICCSIPTCPGTPEDYPVEANLLDDFEEDN